MKRNKIIIGSLGVVAAAAFLVTSPLGLGTKDAVYAKEGLSSLQPQDASDAQAWLDARYIDVRTGLKATPETLAEINKQVSKVPRLKNSFFKEVGPDNIGGRTRAICIDRGADNRLWAGGVSGGLWTSLTSGNNWYRVGSFPGSPFISSMTMTKDRKLFVATGSLQESWSGDGVWMSDDFGVTWSQVPNTSSFASVTEVVSDDVNNVVWMATSSGLRKYDNATGVTSAVTVGSGICQGVQISKNGQVLVAAIGSNRTYISNDGGNTWTDKSGSAASNLVPQSSPRIEYAISASKNSSNMYSIYAVRTNSNLMGMHVSHDNGNTWYEFVGASGTPSNLDIYRNQGTYNSIVSVVPYNAEKIMIGGIDIWKWEQNVNNPPSGGFEKLTNWFAAPSTSKYVHADNHEMKWDSNHRLYMGNDGGVNKSNDLVNFYPVNRGYNVTQFYGIAFDKNGAVLGGTQDNGTLYNDHSLSTWQEFREVNGGDGFECEISFFNPNVMFSTVYNNALARSGDAGVSFTGFGPTLPGTYDPIGTSGNFHPFHSEIFLAEYYDLNSEDSVIFIAKKNYTAGDVITIPSASSGDSMTYTTPTNLYFDDTVNFEASLTTQDIFVTDLITGNVFNLSNYTWNHTPGSSQSNPPVVNDSLEILLSSGLDTIIVDVVAVEDHYYGQNSVTGEVVDMGTQTEVYNVAWDTLHIQDPYQSWFLMYINANGGELWGTRNALRLASQDQNWIPVARGFGGGVFNSVDVEFSKDLNHCYISSGSGVWRVDGLGSIYTSDPDFKTKAGYHAVSGTQTAPTATTATKISLINCEGIAINPNNEDDLIIMQGTGGIIRRTANATAATPTFTQLGSITSPNPAVYDGIIDRNNPNIIVLGTSVGAFISEDGGATFYNASAGFDGTPVYEVRQSWRTAAEGNNRSGEIYLGTFGRGIWASETFLSVDNGNGTNNEDLNFKAKLTTFPNPTVNSTTLSYNLNMNSDVDVYVFNISGKLVKTINKKNVSKGANNLTIDAAGLPKGTYIVKLKAGSLNETTKFIKM